MVIRCCAPRIRMRAQAAFCSRKYDEPVGKRHRAKIIAIAAK
jgi:hypothetical protein